MAEQTALKVELSGEATAELANYAVNVRYEDLPPEVIAFAKHCVLDWVGVTLAGSRDETGELVLAEAREEGGNPQATIVGYGDKTSVMQAALVNGTFSHALDYDDVNATLSGHPSVPVVPVILALAERDGYSGRQIIEAFVAGVEVECRIGKLFTPDHYARGFHSTGTIGTIGAAAAACRLMRLDARTTAVAFGIAATQAAGLKSMFGTMCKPLHAGKAAANGLYGALMAKRGFTARADVLDCDQGFTTTHTGATDERGAMQGMGADFYTSEVLFKYHAACYGTHATIEAAGQIREKYDISPADVDGYEIKVPLHNLRMCDIQKPTTGLEAKFSLRMTAAMALSGENTASIDNYNADLCRRPELVSLMNSAKVGGDAGQGQFQAEVTVRTKDGLVLREIADAGIPDTDVERQQRRLGEKFISVASPVIGEETAQRVMSAILSLDQQNAVGDILGDTAT